jgi:hypothetical protein
VDRALVEVPTAQPVLYGGRSQTARLYVSGGSSRFLRASGHGGHGSVTMRLRLSFWREQALKLLERTVTLDGR